MTQTNITIKLQRQLSNGNWVELKKEELDPYMRGMLKIEGIVAKNQERKPKTEDEIIEALKKGKEVDYGQNWYASIRAKPKPRDPRLGELSYLKEQYYQLESEIMEGEEPSVPSNFNNTRRVQMNELSKKIKKLTKEIKTNKFIQGTILL